MRNRDFLVPELKSLSSIVSDYANDSHSFYTGYTGNPLSFFKKSMFEKLINGKLHQLKQSTKSLPELRDELKQTQDELKKSHDQLKEKEKQLHDIRRAARDALLDEVLGDFGLPGGINSSVKGIAIKLDQFEFGSVDDDKSPCKLEDKISDTVKLEDEIKELKIQCRAWEKLSSELSDKIDEKEQSRRRVLIM